MKRTFTTLAIFLFVAIQTVFAANITITISGFSYSPSSTSAVVGDVVTIQASTTHPLVEVDQITWNANGNTPKSGGWGTKTSTYTFTVTTVADIYYVCANHVSTANMKGMITVSAAGVNQVIATAYSINLYPNPVTSGDLTVKAEGFNGTGKILIYGEDGKLFEVHDLAGAVTNVKTKLPAGMYFYSVMVGNQQVSRNKMVVTGSK